MYLFLLVLILLDLDLGLLMVFMLELPMSQVLGNLDCIVYGVFGFVLAQFLGIPAC